MEGGGRKKLDRADAAVGRALGGGPPAAEVDCIADEGDWPWNGSPSLEGVDRAGEGGRAAARGGDGHAGGS